MPRRSHTCYVEHAKGADVEAAIAATRKTAEQRIGAGAVVAAADARGVTYERSFDEPEEGAVPAAGKTKAKTKVRPAKAPPPAAEPGIGKIHPAGKTAAKKTRRKR